VDTITAHPTNWLVHIEGRDLTRRFIDNKTEEAYVNQTSSQIVSLLAAKEGLSVQATPTTTPVGRYYQIDHDRISLDQFHRSLTEWDLITMLARYEGFDAYVDGTTLYFQKATPPSADPWVARWQIDENGIQSSNLLDLQMERALTIAKGIQVVVKSWHGKRARAFVRGAPASTEIRSPSQSNTQQYIIVRPNLTEDQAQQLANQVYSDLSRHEKVITGQACGDMLLTPRVVIRLTGTGTDWDQVYYPVEITRHIDDHGFLMDFRAHILPPAAESVL
jgi:phage protein D